jgi:imidazolonepropionase-like amidohydrolase
MRTSIPLLAAAVVASVPASGAAAQAGGPDLLITGATVVDVRSGALLPNRTIAIRGDSILSVTTARPAGGARAARVIDARGKFVIPGLSDMHVHFGGGAALVEENRNLLPLYVAHGVTTVRDAAADLSGSVIAWRDSIARGLLLGPRIFTSGPKLEGINSVWPGDLEVGSRREVDAALDSLAALRVDFVKLTDNTLRPELFLYALGRIRARGLKSSAHVPQPVAVRDAVAAGLGSIEHMAYAIRAGSPREAERSRARAEGRGLTSAPAEDAIAGYDEATAVATYRLMARRGTAITPTLTISRTLAYLDREDHAADAYLQYIGRGLRETYRGRVERAARDDSAAVARRHRVYEFSSAKLPLLQRAGVLILAGTDAGFLNSYVYPGVGLHQELELLVAAGLSPLQALRAATINGARFLGRGARAGTVERGRGADLVILDRDPLRDVRATRAIHAVVLRGAYLDRAALDALLADAKRAVR